MNPETTLWLSRQEAADRFGASYDKIRRAHEQGRLPSARRRDGDDSPTGTWEYPLAELIETGLVDPLAQGPAVPVPAHDAGDELAYLRRRVAELEVRLERRDVEFDRLTALLELAMGRAA